ncbi:MAG TPA: UDP-3-O-(3-hydroxymyristoyl)glucosamine N-acyltransferase [Usitatibacter sp.]|nr:UDP-3-O-(3-hydroxymyristoyl)glucosamine N-acyltransferase [Usitatibacter sp.]
MATDRSPTPQAGPAPELTLREIVARLGGEAVGDASVVLRGVATLDSAGVRDIAFLANSRYRAKLATTRAGAVILGRGDRDAASMPRIVSDNPYAYYARTVALFHPQPAAVPGVHPTAQVHPGARVDAGAEVGAYAMIGPRTTVAHGAVIGAHVALGADVAIGEETRLNAGVAVYDRCTIGARCVVHSGAVIGADGFGMARDAGRWIKIPQVGAVRIGDDVEIGANTTIDRGALDDTVIEEGVKLDNQIQVAHNCVIGAHTVIAGCTGISGSVTIGKNCMIGGGVGIVGHLSICDNVSISGMTLVAKSITRPGTYTSGLPMMPHAQWLKSAALIRRLDRIAGRRAGALPGEDLEPDDDH